MGGTGAADASSMCLRGNGTDCGDLAQIDLAAEARARCEAEQHVAASAFIESNGAARASAAASAALARAAAALAPTEPAADRSERQLGDLAVAPCR